MVRWRFRFGQLSLMGGIHIYRSRKFIVKSFVSYSENLSYELLKENPESPAKRKISRISNRFYLTPTLAVLFIAYAG